MTPVFSHGDLRLYLLNLLDEGPRHGYDIMQALADRTGGTYTPSAGTIYPRLAKLEEEGLVSKTVDGRKTVYAITAAGHAEVEARCRRARGHRSRPGRLRAAHRRRSARKRPRGDEEPPRRPRRRRSGRARRPYPRRFRRGRWGCRGLLFGRRPAHASPASSSTARSPCSPSSGHASAVICARISRAEAGSRHPSSMTSRERSTAQPARSPAPCADRQAGQISSSSATGSPSGTTRTGRC